MRGIKCNGLLILFAGSFQFLRRLLLATFIQKPDDIRQHQRTFKTGRCISTVRLQQQRALIGCLCSGGIFSGIGIGACCHCSSVDRRFVGGDLLQRNESRLIEFIGFFILLGGISLIATASLCQCRVEFGLCPTEHLFLFESCLQLQHRSKGVLRSFALTQSLGFFEG